jgi:transposase-like protein
VQRPRIRAVDGSGELPVPAYELFSSTEILGRMAMQKMLAGVSTRRYPTVGLEPVGVKTEQAARSVGRSAISRRFVAATETALAELLAAPLGELDLVALMIDGINFGEHLCVCALGIGIDGIKHPLALVEGDTENTTVVKELLSGLRERGLDTTRPILVGIDGAKALTAAVKRVFDHPVIQRCQLHKVRNVEDRLPKELGKTVAKRMRKAYHAESALAAEAQLEGLARELDKTHSGAAASLREGNGRDADRAAPRRAAHAGANVESTNAIESMNSIARDHARNVKNWQSGNMALRWCAAGMAEAGKQFRRVNGHLHLASLRRALDEQVDAENVSATRQNDTVTAAA